MLMNFVTTIRFPGGIDMLTIVTGHLRSFVSSRKYRDVEFRNIALQVMQLYCSILKDCLVKY